MWKFLLVSLFFGFILAKKCSDFDNERDSWFSGRNGHLLLPVSKRASLTVTLSRNVREWQVYCSTHMKRNKNVFTFRMNTWHTWCPGEDGKVRLEYQMLFRAGPRVEVASIKVGNQVLCGGTPQLITTHKPATATTKTTTTTTKKVPTTAKTTTKIPTTTPTTTTKKPVTTKTTTTVKPLCRPKYNYTEVLHKSLLFYEAQRSGKLPKDNRIPWRADSPTSYDVTCKHYDVSGGYFDAGDLVKFNFPQAAAMTVLAWGMIEYREGYKFAGEWENALKALKWATDYFVKCHTGKFEFVGQVGTGADDHSKWQRARDLSPESRVCYFLTQDKPGSDLLAEVSSTLAAAAIVFQEEGETEYNRLLLSHAEELYEFADTYRGKYSDSISDAKIFYKSHNGYEDELTFAAAWLYRATRNATYLKSAEAHWWSIEDHYAGEFSWDSKARGAALLLYHATNKQMYADNTRQFCGWLEHSANRTPSGMVFLQQWGSNRHAANAAFVCLLASKYNRELEFTEFSREQIHQLLGDAGRSYVVGFGTNPPQRPHHAGASCTSTLCGWAAYHSHTRNPHILYGALVGGVKTKSGFYEDLRTNYVTNEVTLDYNAGFQSSMAGLLQLQANSRC